MVRSGRLTYSSGPSPSFLPAGNLIGFAGTRYRENSHVFIYFSPLTIMPRIQHCRLCKNQSWIVLSASWDAIQPRKLSIVEPTLQMWPWWMKIPTEDFADETLAIDDTQGNDVRGDNWGAGHGGWQGDIEVDKLDQHDDEDTHWRLFWYADMWNTLYNKVNKVLCSLWLNQ